MAAIAPSTPGSIRSVSMRIWWWSVPKSLGDQVGVLELVALLAADGFEADAERLQPVLAGLGEQRDDEAGVDAAGQQHPDRHVGHHAAARRRSAATPSSASCQSRSDQSALLRPASNVGSQ